MSKHHSGQRIVDRNLQWRRGEGLWLPARYGRHLRWPTPQESSIGDSSSLQGDLFIQDRGGTGLIVPVGLERARSRFPGTAKVRDHERTIAKRQLVTLTCALALSVGLSVQQYGNISYNPPPLATNTGQPGFEIDVPAKIESASFDISGVATTVNMKLADWTTDSPVAIASPAGETMAGRILQIRGLTQGEVVADWKPTTDTGESLDGEYASVSLLPQRPVTLDELSVTLQSGKTSESGEFEFFRNARVDVVGSQGVPASSEGSVAVDTSQRSIDRFSSGGVSRPGESEGSVTTYSVSVEQVPGANFNSIPVPAVAVDLIDVDRSRSRDPLLLLLGALIGFAGGVLIEVLLTGAHVLTRQR